jgi:hypothetical protein
MMASGLCISRLTELIRKERSTLQSNVQIVTAGAVGFNLTLLTPTQAF